MADRQIGKEEERGAGLTNGRTARLLIVMHGLSAPLLSAVRQ